MNNKKCWEMFHSVPCLFLKRRIWCLQVLVLFRGMEAHGWDDGLSFGINLCVCRFCSFLKSCTKLFYTLWQLTFCFGVFFFSTWKMKVILSSPALKNLSWHSSWSWCLEVCRILIALILMANNIVLFINLYSAVCISNGLIVALKEQLIFLLPLCQSSGTKGTSDFYWELGPDSEENTWVLAQVKYVSASLNSSWLNMPQPRSMSISFTGSYM